MIQLEKISEDAIIVPPPDFLSVAINTAGALVGKDSAGVVAPLGGGGGGGDLEDALSSINELTPIVDSIPYYTGADTAGLTTLTPYGRSLLEAEDATEARATLFVEGMTPGVSTEAESTEFTPLDMTWKRVGTARPFQVLDEKHLHFESAWESGTVGPFFDPNDGQSRLLNTLITVADGKAVLGVAGAGFVPSNVHPKSPWCSCQAVIDSITGAEEIGPALIKDADTYVYAAYNQALGQIILVDDKPGVGARLAGTAYTPVFPFTLTLKLMGSTMTAWVGDKLMCMLYDPAPNNPYIDFRDPATWEGFCYGLRTSGGTAVVSKLRGGAPGIMGAENILLVTYGDGSPYYIGKKVLMTADCHGIAYLHDWRTALWLVDLDTAVIEPIGWIYHTMDFGGGVIRHAAGNWMRLSYHEDRGKWLLTVLGFDGWDQEGTTNARGLDSYAWVDIDPYGENYVNHEEFTVLGYSGTGCGFTANTWKEGDVWHSLSSQSAAPFDADNPAFYTALRPSYFTGPSLDDLTLVWRDDAIGVQQEGGMRMRVNGHNWFHWSSSNVSHPFPVYNSNAGTELGQLRDISRYGDTPGTDSAEAWAEWIPRMLPDGTTEFFCVGNTKEIFNAAGVNSHLGAVNMLLFVENRGALAVWKADQVTKGYEFPRRSADGRILALASTFAAPVTTTLNTSLRFAFPLTTDLVDDSDFVRLLTRFGTVTLSSPNGADIGAESGLYCREANIINVAGDWTMSVAIKLDALSIDATIMMPGGQVFLKIENNAPSLVVLSGGSYRSINSATAIDETTTRHHVLARSLNNVLSVWLDGLKVAQATWVIDTSPTYLSIGGFHSAYTGYPTVGTYSNSFDGDISRAKFWQRALTDPEIIEDYAGGAIWMP